MDVYKYAQDTITDTRERGKYIKDSFEKLMRRMRKYIVCRELNIIKHPMTYVFEHIKDAIVEIVTAFIPESNREYLSQKNWSDIKWRKTLLDVLINLGYRPIILWL